MEKENITARKTYAFALRIVKLYKYLVEEKHEWVLARQVLKSGTSIGANIEEANGAQSKQDFVAKVSIAYKEARETNYWLRLLQDGGYLDESHFHSIYKDCGEIQKILSSILITTKTNTILKLKN
jgi:four helix bundle protein